MKKIATVIQLGTNQRVAIVFATSINNDRVTVVRCFCQGGLAALLSMNTKLEIEPEITATDLVLLHGTGSLKTIAAVIEEEIKQSRHDCCVGEIEDDERKSKEEVWSMIRNGDTIKCTDEHNRIYFETVLGICEEHLQLVNSIIRKSSFLDGSSWCKEITIAKFKRAES